LLPTYEEQSYIQPSPDHQLNVVDTPAGRLGILIGSDSWYPENYRTLNEQRRAIDRRARVYRGQKHVGTTLGRL
jgi:predicted amidohydrolase